MLSAELKRTSARLRPSARTARDWPSPASARGSRASCMPLVAQTVAAMVVHAEAARSLLDRDLAQADVAMGAIEDTGRQTLGEMRRILGVLRDGR